MTKDQHKSPGHDSPWRAPRGDVTVRHESIGGRWLWVARDVYGVVAISNRPDDVREHLAQHRARTDK